MAEGWTVPSGAEQAHYFKNGKALCGGWNIYGYHILTAGNLTGNVACKICLRTIRGGGEVMKSRMFHLDRDRPIKTWNPVGGCKHHCYKDGCWAARQAPRIPRYKDGFDHPKLFENELKKRFKGGVVVFVSSMGDLFGEWVPDEWIRRVLAAMQNSPDAAFLLETKNPARYRDFLRPAPELIPKNTILSTTIESNRDYRTSAAPPPNERYEAMRDIDWPLKHISIEPIMKFDSGILVAWIQAIKPVLVSVGYDNYNCGLREPSLLDTQLLIEVLRKFTKVETKTLREGRVDA